MLDLLHKGRTSFKGKTTAHLPDKTKSIGLHVPTICCFNKDLSNSRPSHRNHWTFGQEWTQCLSLYVSEKQVLSLHYLTRLCCHTEGKWMPAGTHPSHTASSHHHKYLRTSPLVRVRPPFPKDCSSRWINDQLLKQPYKWNGTDGGWRSCLLGIKWPKEEVVTSTKWHEWGQCGHITRTKILHCERWDGCLSIL